MLIRMIINLSNTNRMMIIHLSYFIVQHLLDKGLLITASNIEIENASIKREVLINDFSLPR
jgi:hypothetical protein